MMLFDCDTATHFMHKIMAFLFSSTAVIWSCFACPSLPRWPAAFGKLNKWHFVLIKNVIEIQDATRMAIGRLLEPSCPCLRLQHATLYLYWQTTTGAKRCFGEFYFWATCFRFSRQPPFFSGIMLLYSYSKTNRFILTFFLRIVSINFPTCVIVICQFLFGFR